MLKLLANNHEGFLYQAKNRTLTKGNVNWALKEYAKANAPKAKPKITPKLIKEKKLYEIQVSYTFDEKGSYKPFAKNGFGDTQYGKVFYEDVNVPSKTLMKQLVTHFLIEGRSIDKKIDWGRLPTNSEFYKRVKVEIISIG